MISLAAGDDEEILGRVEAEIHFQRGRTLFRAGRFEDALAALTAACEVDPTYNRARAAKAHALKRLGRFQEALAEVEAVLAVEPANAVALATKGSALQMMHRQEEGQRAFQDALAAAGPEDQFLVHYNYACFWANADNAEMCRVHLRRALTLEPDKKRVAAADRDFRRFATAPWFQNLVAFSSYDQER